MAELQLIWSNMGATRSLNTAVPEVSCAKLYYTDLLKFFYFEREFIVHFFEQILWWSQAWRQYNFEVVRLEIATAKLVIPVTVQFSGDVYIKLFAKGGKRGWWRILEQKHSPQSTSTITGIKCLSHECPAFCDFSGLNKTIPGVSRDLQAFKNFPGFPGPVRTLCSRINMMSLSCAVVLWAEGTSCQEGVSRVVISSVRECDSIKLCSLPSLVYSLPAKQSQLQVVEN